MKALNARGVMHSFKLGALCLLLPLQSLHATEFTGRFSMLGSTAVAEEGDIGYQADGSNALSADQQSVRLMLEEVTAQGEWSFHLRSVRRHVSDYPLAPASSSELFRYWRGAGNWLDEAEGERATRIGYEVDRLVYRHRFTHFTLGAGRQAIDWGSGRFWQPLNVFGAFAPTDLDTDYKPGIDALRLEAYPSAFSTLSAAYVPGPEDESAIRDSGALHYRRQVGELSELSLLGGSVIGNRVIGAGFESAVGGMGWRVEGVHYTLDEQDETGLFWIAGVDYQFRGGTLVAVEWYDNSRGATHEEELPDRLDDPLVVYGLQPYLGRQVLGVLIEQDITPLLHGGYTLLGAGLDDADGQWHASLLHQINFTYSVSNESDLLLSLMYGSGKGMSDGDELQSEFGHLPASMTLRLRFYF